MMNIKSVSKRKPGTEEVIPLKSTTSLKLSTNFEFGEKILDSFQVRRTKSRNWPSLIYAY